MTMNQVCEVTESKAIGLMEKSVLAYAKAGNYRIYRVPTGDVILDVATNKWFYRIGRSRNGMMFSISHKAACMITMLVRIWYGIRLDLSNFGLRRIRHTIRTRRSDFISSCR